MTERNSSIDSRTRWIRSRVKEVLPKAIQPDSEVTEIAEPSSTQKKSRLDTDDDSATLADDGQIWSKPLPETRETTRWER